MVEAAGSSSGSALADGAGEALGAGVGVAATEGSAVGAAVAVGAGVGDGLGVGAATTVNGPGVALDVPVVARDRPAHLVLAGREIGDIAISSRAGSSGSRPPGQFLAGWIASDSPDPSASAPR